MENPSESAPPDHVQAHAAPAPHTAVVSGTVELLAIVPHQLGYQPGRSVVMMVSVPRLAPPGRTGPALTGAHPGTCRAAVFMTARFDLPEADEVEAAVAALAHPLSRAARERGGPLLLHTFAYEADNAVGAALARAVARLAEEQGFVMQDLVLVRGGAYLPLVAGGRPLDEDKTARELVPAQGWVPVPAAADVPAVADLVLQGRFVAGSRDDVAARVRHRDEAAASATQLALTLLAMAPQACDQLGALERLGRWVVRGEEEPAPRHRAAIAVALTDRTLRDAVMARWLPSLFSVEDVLPLELARDVRRTVPPWPTGDLGALDRLLALTARLPERESVPLLTIAGAVAWGTGEGTVANEAVDLALERDATYTMADLLRQALDRGMAPRSLRADVA